MVGVRVTELGADWSAGRVGVSVAGAGRVGVSVGVF
jgi:hypothetical protein